MFIDVERNRRLSNTQSTTLTNALAHAPPIQDSRDSWGERRRRPPRSSPTWAVRHPLGLWLHAQAAELAARAPLRVLDVGCGGKPYYPYFASIASSYVGVDAVDNPIADLSGQGEELPVEDASFDLVLCTQVLEHCAEPLRVVRELRRVTAPGGRVLASTHGVQIYHPAPHDYHRWTHEGLELLFTVGGPWESVTVSAGAGTASALAMLLGTYLESALGKGVLARGPIWLLNTVASTAERRSAKLREPVLGSLIPNFHVLALA